MGLLVLIGAALAEARPGIQRSSSGVSPSIEQIMKDADILDPVVLKGAREALRMVTARMRPTKVCCICPCCTFLETCPPWYTIIAASFPGSTSLTGLNVRDNSRLPYTASQVADGRLWSSKLWALAQRGTAILRTGLHSTPVQQVLAAGDAGRYSSLAAAVVAAECDTILTLMDCDVKEPALGE